LTIVFSILRSLLLTILLSFSLLLPGPAAPWNPLSPLEAFDVFVVDQQSVCVPLLRLLSGSRVVFYCHFPDKLLSQGWEIGPEGKSVKSRSGFVRKVYRWPIDKLEEFTTGASCLCLHRENRVTHV
jgi:alpha-1,3/alpha-1,6-mannosyltransferase